MKTKENDIPGYTKTLNTATRLVYSASIVQAQER